MAASSCLPIKSKKHSLMILELLQLQTMFIKCALDATGLIYRLKKG